jgi:hypothetical protein
MGVATAAIGGLGLVSGLVGSLFNAGAAQEQGQAQSEAAAYQAHTFFRDRACSPAKLDPCSFARPINPPPPADVNSGASTVLPATAVDGLFGPHARMRSGAQGAAKVTHILWAGACRAERGSNPRRAIPARHSDLRMHGRAAGLIP